jgi:hypothetical protein
MSLFHKFKYKAVINRKHEENLYALVASEMAEGIRNSALWLKALEEANGNSEKQISEYIKLRVQSLKDDIHIFNSIPAEEPISFEKAYLKLIEDVEDLVVMIEDGASKLDILNYLSDKSDGEVKLLINQFDACEQYPLHVAVKYKRADIVELLLKAGAQYNSVNDWGKTPLDIAIKQENEEITDIIESFIT